MKVLHVTPSYEPAWHLGGVVRSLSQLCRGLSRCGVEVTVFATDSGRDQRMPVPLNGPVELGGVKVHYFKTDVSLRYAYSQELAQTCRRRIRDFDLVHVTSFWCYPALAAIPPAQRSRVPYLVSTHGTLRPGNLQDKFVKKWLYYWAIEKRNVVRAAAIHYTSEMERELDAFHRFRTPSFVVPNGFDLEEFRNLPNVQEARQEWRINSGSLIITFIGRLHKVKALDLLIKALADGALRAREVQLMLAGPDGGEGEYLRKLVYQLELGERVQFLGMVSPERRNSLLAASDVAALVSTDENFGITAVEAMLAGVPVLVSDRVGICREVAADGAGMVVPLRSDAMACALNQMLSDPARLKAMGQRAAVAARRRYDIGIVAQKIAAAYEDILAGRRSFGLSWSDFN